MLDPKFEKDVQQKMEELSFAPSDAVWLKVEKAIGVEKKRRVLPFWLIWLPAVLLVGGAALYFLGDRADVAGRGKPAPAGAAGTGKQAPAEKGGDRARRELTRPEGNEAVISGEGQGHLAGTGPKDGAMTESGQTRDAVSRPGVKDATAAGVYPAGRTGRSGKRRGAATGPEAKAGGANAGGISRMRKGAAGGHADGVRAVEEIGLSGGQAENEGLTDNAGDRLTAGKAVAENVDGHITAMGDAHYAKAPGLSRIDRQVGAIGAKPASGLMAGKPAVIRLKCPARPWEAGFTAGLGGSAVNQGLLDQSSIQTYDYRNYASAVQGLPHTYTNKIRPGISFYAGVMLQKGLSSQLDLSLGLNIHYYSSHIKTGSKVEPGNALSTPVTNVSSLLLNGLTSSAAGYAFPYYTQGSSQDYTNRYYFLELPASLSWQAGHIRRMPLYWDAGVSLSYVMGSSALYYNAKTGIYYKDASQLNKTQVSVFTGLMIGLPIPGMEVQAGPQLQYGFTDLLKSGSSGGGQHLLYGGLRLVFLPGKTKKPAVKRLD